MENIEYVTINNPSIRTVTLPEPNGKVYKITNLNNLPIIVTGRGETIELQNNETYVI